MSYILLFSVVRAAISCLLIFLNVVGLKQSMTSFANIFVVMNAGVAAVYIPILFLYPGFSGELSHYGPTELVLYHICGVLLEVGVVVGYATKLRTRRASLTRSTRAETAKLRKTTHIYLLIGIVLYAVYLKAYGSYSNYLEHSLALRIGRSPVDNSFSFLQPFGEFFAIASMLFLGMLLDSGNRKKYKSDMIGFLVSTVLSVAVLYANRGRLAMLVYFLILFLSGIAILFRSRLLRFFLAFCSCLTGFMMLWHINILLNRGTYSSMADMIIGGMSFVPKNFLYWVQHLDVSSCRYMVDLLLVPIFFLPSKIWSGVFGLRTVSQLNTKAIKGSFKGVGGVTGETPVDLLTFGYMELGIVGVLVVGLLFGRFLKLIRMKTRPVMSDSMWIVTYFFVVFQIIMRTILVGDPENVVTRLFGAVFVKIVVAFGSLKNVFASLNLGCRILSGSTFLMVDFSRRCS